MTTNKHRSNIVIKISSKLLVNSTEQHIQRALPGILFNAVEKRKKGVRVAFVIGHDSSTSGGSALFGSAVKVSVATLLGPNQRNQNALELVHRAANMHLQMDVVSALALTTRELGVDIVPLYVTRSDWADQRRYERFRDIVRTIIAAGAIPAVFANELFASDDFDWNHDQLACLAAVAIQADETTFVCAEGEMVDPVTNINYCTLGTIIDMDLIPVSKSPGIVAKINAARLLSGFGIEMLLATANSENANESPFMESEKTVTRVRPRGQRLGQMKSWIALAASSKGELEVSTFLADNLRNGNAVSILAIGVENVRGAFTEGDIVTVIDAGGSILGRGRCRISAERLSKLMGALGNPDISINSRSEIVIHCDYFALNPALSKRK